MCHPYLKFVVIHWAHSSLFASHPGISKTLFVAQQWFWWPSMKADVAVYVVACPVCACDKTFKRPATGQL